MKVIRVHEAGGAEALRFEEVSTPDPSTDEVLERVSTQTFQAQSQGQGRTDGIPVGPSM